MSDARTARNARNVMSAMDRMNAAPPEGYNESQWAAITECDRHLLVAAGAGTGKTHTVVGKLLWLLGVPIGGRVHDRPLRMRDVAAITFTNQAAADLERKLRKALRAAGRRDLAHEVDVARVGTIHSFCGDVLREFALRGASPLGAQVLEEGESAALMAECARDALLEALESQQIAGLEALLADYTARDVERWVSRLASDADRLERLTKEGYDHADARERALLRLASETLGLLGDRLVERGAVDFDRMIVATRDLMREDESVRRALRRRIRVLVVDEFQDVDPVQRDIAYLLGGLEEGARDDMRDDTCGDTGDGARLMLVGDPKQSIYRFRRADVTVWNEVERRFGPGGEGRVVTLAENFRSVAPVLALVEHGVGPALDEPVDTEGGARQPFEVPFAPVRVTRTRPGDVPAHAGVEFLVVPPDAEGNAPKMELARAAEARGVAERMVALNREHGVPWREMAILLTGWGALDIYQDALRRRGIPTYALRSGGFYDAREVVDLLLALQVARDPRDDRALVGFLRGPFVGVKDETLLAMARQCHRPYWDHLASCVLHDAEERALVERGRALVERLVALRDRVPVGRLLEDLVYDTGHLAHLALLGAEGAQGIANVRKLLDELHRRPDVSVGELLREIEECRDRGDDVQQARLFGEKEDVVTLTSVHSSKGLEWGVVFWCDLARAPRAETEKLLVGRDRICLGDPEADAKAQGEAWCALQERLRHEALAEQRRLWYVAATRARDLLVLSGVVCGKGARLKGTPAAMLTARYGALAEGVECEVEFAGQGATFRAPVRVADLVQVLGVAPGAVARPVLDAGSLPLPPAPIEVPLGRGRHSATSLMALDRCARRHWMKYVVGVREPAMERFAPAVERGARGGAAVVHGQVVHDVLERLRDEAELEALLEEAIERWDGDAPSAGTRAGQRLRERLAEEIRRAAAHPAYAAIASLPTARRELAFLHVVNETVQVTGSMDLAACDDGRVVILDVKTSRVESAAEAEIVAARYDVQRDVYGAAAAAISGLPVSGFAFHFTHAGVQVDGGEAGDATPLLDAAGVGEPAMARDPRECLGCGYRAAGWCAGVEMGVATASTVATPSRVTS
ncbi:MAG TPA: UvrD-helicase domain-containing protein [Gemmatimonadaceae bacterium]|nr:UvrD-helicase domain-containing protein [Gemmatimonadaceae bacterium]